MTTGRHEARSGSNYNLRDYAPAWSVDGAAARRLLHSELFGGAAILACAPLASADYDLAMQVRA